MPPRTGRPPPVVRRRARRRADGDARRGRRAQERRRPPTSPGCRRLRSGRPAGPWRDQPAVVFNIGSAFRYGVQAERVLLVMPLGVDMSINSASCASCDHVDNFRVPSCRYTEVETRCTQQEARTHLPVRESCWASQSSRSAVDWASLNSWPQSYQRTSLGVLAALA